MDDRPAEILWGVAATSFCVGVAAVAGGVLQRAAREGPAPARVLATAVALQPAFALRGLLTAARAVEESLESDLDEARVRVAALVSRDRELDRPHLASAAIESLAENLNDSVLAPLLAYALGGLPCAYAYRAANTLDAMIGYRGEYEFAGKAAARLDDALNLVPARLAGLLFVGEAAARGRGAAAVTASRRARGASASPNKLCTIAPMAALLDVQLDKPGHYRVGEPGRPLSAAIVAEARYATWIAGAASVALSAAVAWGVTACRARGGDVRRLERRPSPRGALGAWTQTGALS